MVTKVYSLAYSGLEVFPIEIEVDIQRGLPAVSIIGLVDTQVKESKDRVRAALRNSGFEFPNQKITINLAPANIKKEGTHFDLAIALGLIASSGQTSFKNLDDYFIIGELSLEGSAREVKGVFPMALKAKEKNKKFLVSFDNAKEALLARDLEIYPVKNLCEAVAFLSGQIEIEKFNENLDWLFNKEPNYSVDFSEVKGQVFAKRALEVAAAGMHNVLLVGPPGVGKTMLARRLPTILPDMEMEEILEVTKIYSISGLLNRDEPIVKTRPFCAPHHTASSVALVGGGILAKPGEISLAHRGVLFLDELPEFKRDCLEALRQPLEDGTVTIARATKHVKFPARFLFVGAMNPCPCGYFGSKQKSCHCSSYQIQKYRNKISGPLLDRIDIQVELADIKTEDIFGQVESESSQKIKERVKKAHQIQKIRFKDEKIFFNSQMNHKQLKKYCILDENANKLLKDAIKHFGFSLRAFDKILKVARTIADLAGKDLIDTSSISEAIQYRCLDKNLWV